MGRSIPLTLNGNTCSGRSRDRLREAGSDKELLLARTG
jgi:hypothetical protein